ncbi:hypothetical protein JHW43_009118 [Diplocarpon mali]|nr:hypothetical protein JHW43_009118 [Diplocarpon mali]
MCTFTLACRTPLSLSLLLLHPNPVPREPSRPEERDISSPDRRRQDVRDEDRSTRSPSQILPVHSMAAEPPHPVPGGGGATGRGASRHGRARLAQKYAGTP